MQFPKFTNLQQSFHAELRNRVNEYFTTNKINTYGDKKMLLKSIFLVFTYVLLFSWMVFFYNQTPVWLLIILSILFGLSTASIGFNIMHDGAHGSFSNKKIMNNLAGWTSNIAGASMYMWDKKHNVLHHTYTNVEGIDDDIEIQPWFRMSESQKKRFIHKFQHVYFVFLYGLLHFFWVFFFDYKKYFTRKIGEIEIIKMNRSEHIRFWLSKIVYLAIVVALPIYLLGLVPFLIGYFISTFVAGFVLSIVFQLAHTVEDAKFITPPTDNSRIETEWAVHQVESTQNFAMNSKLVNWYVGGLNFQIEHHLFPKISHIHYPAISKIVQKVCAEFNVPYIAYPTMSQAVISHISFLRKMGH